MRRYGPAVKGIAQGIALGLAGLLVVYVLLPERLQLWGLFGLCVLALGHSGWQVVSTRRFIRDYHERVREVERLYAEGENRGGSA